MVNKKRCVDFYGERLKVGDEVIPMLEEALIIGIRGVVSKIQYSEKYDSYYITIVDKDGKVLLNGVNARCYTTQERYNIRENQKYVYSLKFYNESFGLITYIPLTSITDANYEIPDDACYVSLGAEHLEKRGKQLTENSWSCDSYTTSSIYYFIVNGNFKLCYDKEDDFYYLLSLETRNWRLISNNYRVLNNKEELKKYVKGIIEYFNSADLTYVNNDEEFAKNEKGKEFEKILINHLNR